MNFTKFLLATILLFFSTIANAALSYEYEKKIALSGTPRGLCLTNNNEIWVALSAENTVVRINADGTILQTLSGFSTPYDVAVDVAGNVYVADRANKCVKRFNAAGVLQQTFACGENVNGVTIAPNGEVYAATLLQVLIFAQDGTLIRRISTLSSDKFREMRKVCFTPDNALYYVDKNTGAIKIADDSSDPASVALLLKKRGGITVYNNLSYAAANAQSELFLVSAADKENSQQGIYRFSTAGLPIDTIGLCGVSASDNGFITPWGIAADAADNLYITDSGDKSIKIWRAIDEHAPEVQVNVWKHTAEKSVRWTLKTNEQSQLYYLLRSIITPKATTAQLLAQAPTNVAANILIHKNITLNNGEWQVDFLLQDKHGNTSEIASSPILQSPLSPPTSIDTIRNRMWELLVGTDTIDYTDEVVNQRYQALLQAAANAFNYAQRYEITPDMTPLNLAGSSATDDILVVRNMAQNALGPLALAYQIAGPDNAPNPYYQNSETLSALLNMFRYLEARGVVQGCTLPFLGGGVYLRLTGIFYAAFLLQNELHNADLLGYATNLMQWATRWINPSDNEWGAHVTQNTGRTDGIRTLYNNRLLYLLTLPSNTPALADSLSYLTQALNSNYQLGSAWNGFLKPDYSAYHHLGMWGNAYTPDALHIGAQTANLLRDTPFAISAQSAENIANGLLAMAQYSCKYDISRGICGRFPNNLTPLYEHIPAFAHIANALPQGELKTQMQQWFNYLFDTQHPNVQANSIKKVGCDITFYGGLGIMEFCQNAQQPTATPNLTLNRTFPYAAMQIHRRPNVLITVKGYSKYVWDFETNGGENWFGRHQAHGSLAIYNGTDNHGIITAKASGVGYDGYDWSHVAGTTAFNMPLTDMLYEAQKFQWAKFSPEWLVGGVSQANNGLFAMKLSDIRQAYDYEHNRQWLGVKLSALKSYFFFDDMVVCLGSNINNIHDTYEAHTTLFQNALPEPTTPILVNGSAQTALNYTFDQTDNAACTLTDAIGNTYIVPNANGLHVQRAAQNSRNDKNTADTQGNYATAWLNHGRGSGGTYEYAIWTKGSTPIANSYSILRQDNTAHIVKHRGSGTTSYAVFSTAQALNDTQVAALSCPALLMIKNEGEIAQITLANPELGFYDKNSFPYQVWNVPNDKKYLAAETQSVTLTLNGHYSLIASDNRAVWENYDEMRDQTTLRFDGQNAESLSITLKNENATTQNTLCKNTLQVYPNPASDFLQITSANTYENQTARVYNAYGALVLQQKISHAKIDISTLASGLYMVEINGYTAQILKR